MNKKQLIFHENINLKTIENENYRKVVFTGKHMQFVYMSIEPLDNIHLEVHENHDQFIRIEKGKGIAKVNDIEYQLSDDIGIIIPAGSKHEIINTSNNEKLKLYSIYAPPEHKENTINIKNPDKDVINYQNKYLKYKNKYLKSKQKNI